MWHSVRNPPLPMALGLALKKATQKKANSHSTARGEQVASHLPLAADILLGPWEIERGGRGDNVINKQKITG